MTDKKKLLNEIRNYAMLTIGLVIGTLGWTAFLIPSKIVGGGLTGIATIFNFTLGWDIGLTALIVNVGLIVVSTRILGTSFGIKTVYAILLSSTLLSVFSNLFTEKIVPDTMMNTIIGGMLVGTSAGIVFSHGGSTGGTDIIAKIINKYKNITLGRLLLSMDVIIISSSYFFVEHSSLETVVYGLMSMAIMAYTVDLIISGTKQTVQFLIISDKPEELRQGIIYNAKRGLTILHGTGGYSGDDRKVLLVISRKTEIRDVFREIQEIDPNAFITVGTVMGVYGHGFDKINHKM